MNTSTHEIIIRNFITTKRKVFSKLKYKEITDGDYKHAQTIYHTHNLKNLDEYNDAYWIINKIIRKLEEENFEMSMHGRLKLNPSSSVTLPSLCLEASIKTTRIKLDLLIDVYIILFNEKDTRRGIARAIRQYAKANNKYMYDYYKKGALILNLDFNFMYGYALSRELP